MSLYSYDFDLLQRPPRSPLSWGSENTRAVLPDFQSVEELRMFVRRLFVYDFGYAAFVQIKVGIALFGAMIIVCFLVIGRRMYERNFWIFRIIRVSSGPIIVPNPILSFGFIEGNFVIVFMALLIIALQYHEYHTEKPRNLILWISLPWCITTFGAIFAAVGTHYATPTSQLPSPEKKSRKFSVACKGLMKNAWVVNGIAVAFPAWICVTVGVPTFIGNSLFEKANNEHYRWMEKYEDYTVFTQEMVREAQEIWFTLLKSTLIASATFCLWFVWASFCFIICSILSLRLLRTIREELSRSNMIAPNFVVTQTRMVTSNHDFQRGGDQITEAQQVRSKPYKAQGRRKMARGDHSFFMHSTNSMASQVKRYKNSFQNKQQFKEYNSPNADNDELTVERVLQDLEQECVKSFDPRQKGPWAIADDQEDVDQTAVEEEEVRLFQDSNENHDKKPFFRKFIPNIVMTTEKAQKNAIETMESSRDEQKKELRKAAIHIFTQYAIVGPGCAAFGGIALLMALTLHGSFEQPHNGGTKFEFFGALALLMVSYAVSFFGWVCAGAIFHRTYEPVFVNYSATATIASFGLSRDEEIEQSSMMKSTSSQLHDFIRVGGGDPIVRNKIRYPQAMVRSLIGNPPQRSKSKNSKKTIAEDISYQSSQADKPNFRPFFRSHTPSLLRNEQQRPKRAIDRQYRDIELQRVENWQKILSKKQSQRFDAEPQEGQLVNNSVVIIRKEQR